jgi:hypothetical protein
MSNGRVSDTENQSAGDICDDRIAMYNAYARVSTVKSEVKEETGMRQVDAGIS